MRGPPGEKPVKLPLPHLGLVPGPRSSAPQSAAATPRRRSAGRPLALAAVGAALLAVVGGGVRATLSAIAENSAPTTVTSGTLLLTLDDDGAGLSTPIEDLAPGDSVDRFVDLLNAGTLDATGLTLALAADGDAVLVADGTAPATTRALNLSVDACTTPWDTGASTCAGVATALLGPTTLSTLVTSPQALAATFERGATMHLRLRFTLPDQTETSVDGVPPTPTIQGATVDVTTTFRVEQRDPTTTSG
jgi:hypothetical protein